MMNRSALLSLKPRSRIGLVIISSLFIFLTANITLLRETFKAYQDQPGGLGFTIAVAIAIYTIIVSLLALLSSKYTIRMVLSITIVVATVSAYFTDTYGTVIDNVMIQNLFETDRAETLDLMTLGFMLRVFFLAVLPIVYIWRVPLKDVTLGKSLVHRGATCVSAVLVLMCVISLNSNRFASYIRDHKILRFYATPLYPIYSFFYFADDQLFPEQDAAFLTILPEAERLHESAQRRLSILIVGETARADRFQLNGYHRKTNPRLSSINNLYSFRNVMSCGTSTAISVPCMFSEMTRDQFDSRSARNQENALDILDRVGVSVLWRDNNSGSKGVADRVAFEDFSDPALNSDCDIECRDTGMLSGLQTFIDQQAGDILIVLHQKGNHGPAYFKRYPAEFEVFTPACNKAELSACSDQEISNAYDNAILYTDHFLTEVIELLESNQSRFDTNMMYVSDHGESLGEKGVYLHGLPYALSPIAQRHIPVLLWHGDQSNLDINSIESRTHRALSHDALFNTLLELYQVDSNQGTLSSDVFLLVAE